MFHRLSREQSSHTHAGSEKHDCASNCLLLNLPKASFGIWNRMCPGESACCHFLISNLFSVSLSRWQRRDLLQILRCCSLTSLQRTSWLRLSEAARDSDLCRHESSRRPDVGTRLLDGPTPAGCSLTTSRTTPRATDRCPTAPRFSGDVLTGSGLE